MAHCHEHCKWLRVHGRVEYEMQLQSVWSGSLGVAVIGNGAGAFISCKLLRHNSMDDGKAGEEWTTPPTIMTSGLFRHPFYQYTVQDTLLTRSTRTPNPRMHRRSLLVWIGSTACVSDCVGPTSVLGTLEWTSVSSLSVGLIEHIQQAQDSSHRICSSHRSKWPPFARRPTTNLGL